MEFRVLGGLEVRAAGLRVDAGHARQRAVLAVLLFDLGRVVPTTHLIDRVWGDDPPITVRNVLYGYVARLRAVIAGAGDPDVTLSRQPGGYQLEADPDQVDLYRFRRLLGEAAAAAGDDDRAGVLLAEAVALWRGAALAGLDSGWLNGMRESLEAQRRTAVLDLGDITLRQGQHRALVTSLAEEAVTCPADERLVGQLMLALYRSGRQAEALQRFEQTRRRLAEEFGADPGPALQLLHRQILRADPSLTMPGTTGNGRAWPVLRQLPADVPAFTGRTAELAQLSKLHVVTAETVTVPAPRASLTPGERRRRTLGGLAILAAVTVAAAGGWALFTENEKPGAPPSGAASATVHLLLPRDDTDPSAFGCEADAVTRAARKLSVRVQLPGHSAEETVVLGRVELLRSARCHAEWARLIPAVGFEDSAGYETVGVIRLADGITASVPVGRVEQAHSHLLRLDGGCVSAYATLQVIVYHYQAYAYATFCPRRV